MSEMSEKVQREESRYNIAELLGCFSLVEFFSLYN